MQSSTPSLKRVLSTRHIQFMALGSAIGTGLFYGSADAIQMACRSVLLAYLIDGLEAYVYHARPERNICGKPQYRFVLPLRAR